MSEENDLQITEAPAPKKSTLLPAFVGVNSLLLLGVLGVLVFKPSESAPEAVPSAAPGAVAAPGDPSAIGPTVRLAEFVIHLRNPEADRYARMSFEVEVGNELDKEKLTPHLPKLRDAFIAYLSDRTLEDMRGSEGLATVKQALLAKMNELVPNAHFRQLYLTDFVIQ